MIYTFKDIQAIDEYLKDPLQIASPMLKTIPSSEEGAEVIPPPVTPMETEVASISTPTTEEGEDLFQLPVTQSEAAVKELEAAVPESNEGPTRPPGLDFVQVSMPLTRVKVPGRPTEVNGIPDLYYQELKEERRQEESKRVRTKKSEFSNTKRQTVDDYYSSTLNDE